MPIIVTGCGCMSRRGFLGGVAAAGLAGRARAQSNAFRIDMHHHLTPPPYIAAVDKSKIAPVTAAWSPQKSLDQMDAAGIRSAMLSLTTPGLYFGDAAASATLARLCNEYAATVVKDHPGRFGSFAAVPMASPDLALAEITYAFDTLGADGVTLFTNYGDRWLGHASMAPVFEELNRRRAIMFTHPISANCCVNVLSPAIPDPMIEWGTDTTRAIANMVFNGFAQRYPDIKIIWSHAGGTMPFLIERFDFQARQPIAKAALPDGPEPLLRRFFYDTAQSCNPEAMGALTKLVPATQIVFGTDFPFRTCTEHVTNLAGCGLDPATLRAIERDNAAAMLPRFA